MVIIKQKMEEDLKFILALLKNPASPRDIIVLLRSYIIQNMFNELSTLECLDYFRPAGMLQACCNEVIFDPKICVYSLADEHISERLACRAITKNPAIAAAVADAIPWQSIASEELGIIRDIRNFAYANDIKNMQRAIIILKRNHPDCFYSGDSFAFLEFNNDLLWLKNCSDEMLSLIGSLFLPLAAAKLIDPNPVANELQARLDSMPESAILALLDLRLMQGNLQDTPTLLDKLSENNAKRLRKAWLAYLQGKNDLAQLEYGELLDETRNQAGLQHTFFQSPGGIFFIFALLRDGRGQTLTLATECCENAVEVPFIGRAYKRIALFIRRHFNILSPPAVSGGGLPTRDIPFPIADFFIALCDVWENCIEHEGLERILPNVKPSHYPWFARECSRIRSLFKGAKFPTDTLPGITGVTDCITIAPIWKRILAKLKNNAERPFEVSNTRLVWACVYDNSDPNCPFILKPVEQRLTKNGLWSKGRNFPFFKNYETCEWPEFFTSQDKIICSCIAEDVLRDNKPKLVASFRSINAIDAAVGHPYLFWDGPSMTPFQCRREKPHVEIQKEDSHFLSFNFSPYVRCDSHIAIPVKDKNDDLVIFPFSTHNTKILQYTGPAFNISKDDSADFVAFLRLFADSFLVFSDVNLDFTALPTSPLDSTPHIRLTPSENHLRIEILFMPFPNTQEFFSPAEGKRELVRFVNGKLIRNVRNFKDELKFAKDIVNKCEVLNDNPSEKPWVWELNTLELCYLFTIALRKLPDNIPIHWPENQKIRISRKLAVSDMNVYCKPAGDWFSVTGQLKVDEGLIISLNELLLAAKFQKGNFIKLTDGQIVALEDSLRRRLDDFAAVSSSEHDALVFNKFALPFLNNLLDGINTDDSANALKKQSEAISRALSFKPKLPKTLHAKLRPYQLEGFTWLSQLDAWGAGACLADDMGLGKTIQAIALILSKTHEGPSLVVAPTSVCGNWLSEINRFAPSLKATVFGGLRRRDIFPELGPGTVLITSYGLMQSDADIFMKKEWRIAVLDEAQAIKNHNAKRSRAAVRLNAKFRMVTTGTPMENNLNELWSIFNFINPGLLNSHERFQDNFAVPIEKNGDSVALLRLTSIIKPFILRRLKKQVLTDLPPKTEIHLHVTLSIEERSFYESLRLHLLDEINGNPGDPSALRMRVIAAITKLRLAACNTRLIMPTSDIPSSKTAIFTELLDDLIGGGHKVLVFSQFVKHLAIIRPILDEKGILYQYLDGSTPVDERKRAVDDFQDGKGDAFLISLKAGGLGLNLTAADYVIHLDPWWNPAVEDQASDRAYRIGQDKPVTIYRLITQNTIEDKILELHQSKRDLADNLLAGTDTVTAISPEELLKLISN